MVLNMPPLNSLVFGGSMLYAIPTFEIQTQISALVYLKHLLKAIMLNWTKVSNLKKSIRIFGAVDKIKLRVIYLVRTRSLMQCSVLI